MVGLSLSPTWGPRREVQSERGRPVAVWLFAVALLVYCMVVVGGLTRLTGSGLSITQWKPVTGALPPLSGDAWAKAFRAYQGSSQYRLINQGIGLGDFKVLFWWEWSHRLLGRTVGVIFALPFFTFLTLRMIPRWLLWRCFSLLGLGALQGLVGWWMVESGLEGRASVAPERLAAHLGLALLLFGGLVWTGLDAWWGARDKPRKDGWTLASLVLASGVFLQCLMGALVAGNQAGLMDSDWPLMAGRFFPEAYWQGGIWATLAHGLAAVQFNHRMLAYGLMGLALIMGVRAGRSAKAPQSLRALVFTVCAAMLIQVVLGIATLWTGVPLPLALLHQANAAIVLGLAVSLAWRARRI